MLDYLQSGPLHYLRHVHFLIYILASCGLLEGISASVISKRNKNYFFNFSWKVAVWWVVFLLTLEEAQVSNLDLQTGHPDRQFCFFFLSGPRQVPGQYTIMSRPPPSTSFEILQSLIILTFELLTGSLYIYICI
jgi:hypothetical protein